MTEHRYFMPRPLLIDCDHLADPLWNVRGGGMIHVEDVPVSEATRQALLDWARRWDRLTQQDMDAEDIKAGMMEGSAEAVPADVWDEHTRDGRVLWAITKEELGPQWQVGWPSGDGHVQWTPGGPVEPLPSPPARRLT